MTRRSKPAVPSAGPPEREFKKLFRRLCGSRQDWQVFSDFCELATLSLANMVHEDPLREERYLGVIGRYELLEERLLFPEMLTCVTRALTGRTPDEPDQRGEFLGSLFMDMGLASHWKGQFFTPYPVAAMMARMTYGHDTVQPHVDEKGYVHLLEPACGAGVNVIAFAEVMEASGMSPIKHLYVTAIDVDPTAAHMCFIQLSLLQIPAEVWVGNTLSREFREVFYTPAYHLGGWGPRLALERSRRSEERCDDEVTEKCEASRPETTAARLPRGGGSPPFTAVVEQLQLFAA